jgi:hypothetical protein
LLAHLLTRSEPPVGAPDLSRIEDPYAYFIRRCCDTDPRRRYANAGEAHEAFCRLTQDTGDLTADDSVLRLVDEWFNTEAGPDVEVVRQIGEAFISNRADEELYTRRLPFLPDDLATQFMDELTDEFVEVLKVYDGHVSGGLAWDYCDTVANYYNSIWQHIRSLDVLDLVVRRLIIMGATHNRWHVRSVLTDLLRGLSTTPEVEVAATAIREEARWAEWHKDYAMGFPLPIPIRQAFESLST